MNRMLREGHAGISALVAAPVVAGLLSLGLYVEGALVGVFIIFSGFLPDLDTRIGIVTHRGIMHTVWFGFAVGAVLGLITVGAVEAVFAEFAGLDSSYRPAGPLVLFAVGVVGGNIGVFSHLLGDIITPHGIRPLEPVSDWKVTAKLTKASSSRANTAFFYSGLLLLGAGTLVGLQMSI